MRARVAAHPGTVAFVSVMLGSVAFDGLSRTEQWVDFRANLMRPVIERSPRLADVLGTLLAVGGLALDHHIDDDR